MFIENYEICNFVDGNTLYSGGMELSIILENLKHGMKVILKLFRINSLKANPRKFQFIILGKKIIDKVKLKINSNVINESNTVELLGIATDNKLTFSEHINNLSRNARRKLYLLRRIRKYLTQDQAKLLYNAFINSQFSYAPSIWMFRRKNQYLKIQKIHKVLKVVFNSDEDYDELLQMHNEITIHQKHLHALICKVLKSLNNSNPEINCSHFTFKNIAFNIRNGPLLIYLMQNLRITALIPFILGHVYCVMVFPSLLNLVNSSLN